MPYDDQTATGVDDSRVALGINLKEPDVGETLAERFLLRSILGSGATGTVYGAVDATVNQRVAIKLLHPDLRDNRTRERLRREVRASRPGHPNIVSVFDLHEAEGHLFLSMEWVEGKSLRSRLDTEGQLPVTGVINLGQQMASALDHLHSKGLIHRDVKPGNILVATDGSIKLCDMGLARPLKEGATVTEAEMIVGTPHYMAPEQATGAELSGASDIYSLGLTLYQALTGVIPLKEPTAIATLSRRQRERPASIRRRRAGCPRWLDRVIRRMLEPNPRDRPPAIDVFKAFETRRLLPKPRRRTLAAAAAFLFIVAAGLAGAHFLARRPTAVVEIGQTTVTGRDSEGRTTWHRKFSLPVAFEQRADITGDGLEEILIVTRGDDRSNTRSSTIDGPEIWIFRSDGSVISHFLPEQEITWPFAYDVEIQATVHLLDLNHDGEQEIIVVGEHINFFPGVVFIFRPDDNHWDQVLTHPGNILKITATPPETGPGFRFAAVNNRLGVLGFVGEILIAEEDPNSALTVRNQIEIEGLQTPPFSSESYSPPYRWSSYIPLPPNSGRILSRDTKMVDLDDGGLKMSAPLGEKITLDRFWNIEGTPNAGRDLKEARMAFMNQLYSFSPETQPLGRFSIEDRRSEMLTRFEPLLDEPAYRLILDLKSARALARADRLQMARNILDQTVLQTNHSDANYRLAHFEALGGDFSRAQKRLIRLITQSKIEEFGTRAFFDGPQLLLRIAIEVRDQNTVDLTISRLSVEGSSREMVRVAESLLARSHLWWDELQPEDSHVKSWGYAPSGEAIACLARWRQGSSKSADVELMDTFIDRNPDARFEGRLARGAALLGNGRNPEALDELSVLVQQLIFPSKDDFAIHQLLDLARALRVVALDADGQTDRARAEARELLTTLTPNLLPSILADEVLARKR